MAVLADTPAARHDRSGSPLRLAAVAAGVTSIATQIILLREFLSVLYGNELLIGVVLAGWMVLTGAGAAAARIVPRRDRPASFSPVLFIGLAVLPVLTVFALRILRNRVFLVGSMVGVIPAMAGSWALLAPFCLMSGFTFACLAVTVSRRRGENRVRDVYSLESAGSAAGALGFNLLLVAWLTTFQALFVLMAIDLGAAWLIARAERRRFVQLGSVLLVCAAGGLMASIDVDRVTRGFLFPGQEILAVDDSPYGNLTVTRQAGQVNIYENNLLLTSTDDLTSDEESVHYALVQRPHPRRVLLIGGGVAGTTREALKYGCDQVDYVELNPWLIGLVRRYVKMSPDRRVRVLAEDARTFVAHTAERYDAVLVNLPDPSTAQLNRFYTLEFYRQVRTILHSGGVFATSLLPGAEYQGHEARLLGSAMLSTLREVFHCILIIPGDRHFFLASDSVLDARIAALVGVRGIETAYVNRFYIDDTLLQQRSAELTASLSGNSAINTDFHPVAYEKQLQYWLSYFGFGAGWLLLVVGVFWVGVFLRADPVSAGMLAGGTAAASAQVLLLVAFQTLCGSLYQMTGFFIAAFMAGLALGAGPAAGRVARPAMRTFVVVQTALAVACLVLWPILGWLHSSDLPLAVLDLVFIVWAGFLGGIVGLQFAVGTQVAGADATRGASTFYGVDLLGSALGALAVSVCLLPEIGVRNVSVVAGAVSLLGAIKCTLAGGGTEVLSRRTIGR